MRRPSADLVVMAAATLAIAAIQATVTVRRDPPKPDRLGPALEQQLAGETPRPHATWEITGTEPEEVEP